MGATKKTGEDVSLSCFNQAIPAGSSQNVLTLYDSNGVARPLQTWERLVIDSVEFTGGLNNSTAVLYDPTTSLPLMAIGSANGSSANTPVQFFGETPGEGINVSVGTTPTIVIVGPSSSAGTTITVQARVINGKSQGFQAGYKAVLTPNGNVTGQ